MRLHPALGLSLALIAGWAQATPVSVIRCAFDVGSGETKVAAARFEDGRVEILYRDAVKIPIRKAVKNGNLPEETVRTLGETLTRLKGGCESRGATQFVGVATSGFRTATENGRQALEGLSRDTGIDLRLISGEEEAVLGYRAVESFVRGRGPLVVWDIGGGSMQFATRIRPGNETSDFSVRSLSIGASTFNELLSRQLGRAPGQKLNPVAENEVFRAVLLARKFADELPSELKSVLKRGDARVIGIGGAHFDSVAPLVGQGGSYTVGRAIWMRWLLSGKSSEVIHALRPDNHYPDAQESNAILVSGLMEALGIKRVRTLELNLTDGLFQD